MRHTHVPPMLHVWARHHCLDLPYLERPLHSQLHLLAVAQELVHISRLSRQKCICSVVGQQCQSGQADAEQHSPPHCRIPSSPLGQPASQVTSACMCLYLVLTLIPVCLSQMLKIRLSIGRRECCDRNEVLGFLALCGSTIKCLNAVRHSFLLLY